MVLNKIQVESNILIENVNHVSTTHQLPFQTILIINDIDVIIENHLQLEQ